MVMHLCQNKLVYTSPSSLRRDIEYEGCICVSKIQNNVVVDPLDEEEGGDHDLVF